ncbi:MAG: hypothetical protein M3Y87_12650 [Myxococcota bacterium]|nr:hypothetical protein [Myxococcota bacterium]
MTAAAEHHHDGSDASASSAPIRASIARMMDAELDLSKYDAAVVEHLLMGAARARMSRTSRRDERGAPTSRRAR